MNGSQSRDKSEILSYNREAAKAVSYRPTSLTLDRTIGRSFFANVLIPTEGALNITHQGYIVFSVSKLSKPVNSTEKDQHVYSLHGLLIHSEKGTIFKIQANQKPIDVSAIACRNRSLPSGSVAPVRYTGDKCVRNFNEMQHLNVQFTELEAPLAEDIGLRFTASSIFRVPSTITILNFWMRAGFISYSRQDFLDDVWRTLSSNTFYFSVPMKKEMELRVGAPKKRVRMKKRPTLVLLVVVSLLLTYCVTSIAVKCLCGIHSGINSEGFTRTAMIQFLKRDTKLNGKVLFNDAGKPIAIGLSTVSSAREYLRLTSADRFEET